MHPDAARALMNEWTPSASLRTHMECVAACMGAYAMLLAPQERDRWVVAGLLHDFDYERHPSAEEHPFIGVAHLRAEHPDVDEEILDAIMGHAEYTGVPRTSEMSRVLYAVDELSGFIVACAKVRPEGIATLEAKSVRKKLKDKAFAAAVDRESIRIGMEEIQAEPDVHITRCIEAIRGAGLV